MRSRQEIKAIARQTYKAQWGMCLLILFLNMLIGGASSFISIFIVPVLAVGVSYSFLQVYTGQKAAVTSLFSGFERYGRNLGASLLVALFSFLWMMLAYVPVLIGSVITTVTGNAVSVLVSLIPFLALLALAVVRILGYSQVNFILADSVTVRALDSIRLSQRLTRGYKGSVFVMELSFIGWTLLYMIPYFIGAGIGSAALVGHAAYVSVPVSPFDALSVLALFGAPFFIGLFISVVLLLVFLTPYSYASHAGLYLELKQNALEQGRASIDEFTGGYTPQAPGNPPLATPPAM